PKGLLIRWVSVGLGIEFLTILRNLPDMVTIKTGFYLSNNFIYVDETKEIEIRDRGLLPISYKNIDHVPPEEIQKAIFETIEMSFSISQTDLISETLSKMGFGRATSKASSIIKSEIKKLIRSQKIKMEQERLVLS